MRPPFYKEDIAMSFVSTRLGEVKSFFATAALKQTIVGGVVTILTPNPEEDVVGHWEAKGY